MPDPETIEDCWLEFARRFMPEEASEFQVRDMRRCFYSGAWTMLGLMMTHRDEGPDVLTRRLDEWQRELVEFQRRLGIDR